MTIRWMNALKYLAMCLSGILAGSGCPGAIAREIEVVFAAAANPFLIRESFLVDIFGVGLLRLFN